MSTRGADGGSASAPPLRGGRTVRGKAIWPVLATVAAALTPVVLLAILVILLISAWPAIAFSGWHFLVGRNWSLGNIYGTKLSRHGGYSAPQGASYGALPFIVGTALTSAGALVLAVPVGLGVAVCLAERAHGRWGRILGFFVELIAGVPSVVFGLWGFIVLVPWLERHGGPGLARVLGFIPFFRGPVLAGQGTLAAVVILAAMILPLIAAVGRDALLRVPREMRDQGRALGLTDWEILRNLVLPEARAGILGGVVLALGRALGETMAVLMVSGTGRLIPHTIYAPTTTMASAIVVDLDSAFSDATGMAVHALAELAVVLLVIAVLVNLAVPIIGRGVSRVAAVLDAGWGEKAR